MDGECYRPGSMFDILPVDIQPVSERPRKMDGAGEAPSDQLLGELVGQMVRRDDAALGRLYDLTVSRVYGVALRVTRQREAAEEVTEDVYLQAWDQADRFDANRGRVLTWLLTICRSRALDYLRRKDEAISHPEPETLAEELRDESSNPEDILLSVEKNSRLHNLIALLPAVQRQLLALAFFRGLSHQEIAEHSGMPLGTVKTHLRRALEDLRLQLSAKSAA